MAHPFRAGAAQRLRSRLHRFPTRICYDPEPDGTRSVVRTARLAWRPWSGRATHHLVLQDDVTLVDDFEATVLRVLGQEPDAALALFSEWGSYTSCAVRLALLSGHAWTEATDRYFPTVAAILPVDLAGNLAARLAAATEGIDDVEMLDFLGEVAGLRSLVTVPHLVEHDGDASIAGNDQHGIRRATVFDATAGLDSSWWERPRLTGIARLAALNFSHAQPSALVRNFSGSGRGHRGDLGAAFADEVSRAEIAAVWQPVLEANPWPRESARLDRRFRCLAEVCAYTALSSAGISAQAADIQDERGDRERLVRLAMGTWAPGALRFDHGNWPTASVAQTRDCLLAVVEATLAAYHDRRLPALSVRTPVGGHR